jgi:hypothetical protein
MPRALPSPLSSLRAAAAQLDRRFSVGGELQLTKPVVLRFDGKKDIPVGVVMQRTRGDVAKKLARHCSPAVFGVGDETVQDTRVRHGRQRLARDGFDVLGFDDELARVLEQVAADLLGSDSGPPRAELYALNLYSRGGHFASHKDTPRDPSVFGTLVACLPVEFSGGRLVLEHETRTSFDWAFSRWAWGADAQAARVQWAAFYGDVDHHIEPVEGGTRVTLTWNLHYPSADTAGAAPRPPTDDTADLHAAVVAALADPTLLADGGLLGVPCHHLYTVSKAVESELTTDPDVLTSRLKGRDLKVAHALQAAGLNVRVVPYLFEADCSLVWRLDRSLTAKEAQRFAKRRLTRDAVDKLPVSHFSDWEDKDDVTWVLPPPWVRDRMRAATGLPEPETTLLGHPEYSHTNYFGNEASDGAFYTAAALIAEWPSQAARASQKPA